MGKGGVLRKHIIFIILFCLFLPCCKNKSVEETQETDNKIIETQGNKLIWTKKDFPRMNWKNAKKVCKKFSYNGLKNWRLPTIEEWRGVIEGCPNAAENGKCKVSETCRKYRECWSEECKCEELKGPGKYGCYWKDKIWGVTCEIYWSGTKMSQYGVWTIEMDSAAIATAGVYSKLNFKCVKKK